MSNPPHQPSDEQRKTVTLMSSHGIPQDDIAAVIGIAPKTLRLHYERELLIAETEANSAVAQSLFQNATKHMNVTAQIFWLKTRARWRETPPAEDAEAPRVIVTGGLPTT